MNILPSHLGHTFYVKIIFSRGDTGLSLILALRWLRQGDHLSLRPASATSGDSASKTNIISFSKANSCLKMKIQEQIHFINSEYEPKKLTVGSHMDAALKTGTHKMGGTALASRPCPGHGGRGTAGDPGQSEYLGPSKLY